MSGFAAEMLKFDASFLYGRSGVIIDFGPNDGFQGRTTRVVLLKKGWSERKAWSKLKKNEYESSNEKSWKAN